MNARFKTMLLASLIGGSLMLSAGPALARDHDWHRWHGRHHGYAWGHDRYSWNRREDLRQDYWDLREARRKLDYDASHHASRKRLARDQARVQDLLNDIRSDRSGWFRD